MSVEIEVVENKDFFEFIVKGTLDLPSLKETVNALKDAQEKYNATRILVNAIGLSGELGELDRYSIGKYAAGELSRNVKFAMLAEDRLVNKFFENVAFNRGLNLIVVDNRQAALDWLLEVE